MERSIPPRIIIDREGWKAIVIEEGFTYPAGLQDHTAYLQREKMQRYVANHPDRLYRYTVGDQEFIADCKSPKYFLQKWMVEKGASEEDIQIATDIAHQFSFFNGKISTLSKRAFGSDWHKAGGILHSRKEELLDLFGSLHTVDEVYRIIVEDWGFTINKKTIQQFYTLNIKEIEKLREAYELDFSDVALTKKRSRLDKLSKIFNTYYTKWSKDQNLGYSRELRAILEQIKKEVEGEQISINIQGQINVELTMEVNKTLIEAYRRVPVNNIILAMVAAKRGIDPTKLMAMLTSSYYNALSGYGKYDPSTQLVHPVDLTYNWNDIARDQKKINKIEDAVILSSTGSLETDAAVNTAKMKLLALLKKDQEENDQRKSR